MWSTYNVKQLQYEAATLCSRNCKVEQLHSAGVLELHLLALPLSAQWDKQTNACCGPFDPLANPATLLLLPAKSPQSSQSYQRHLSSVLHCMALKHICICLEEGAVQASVLPQEGRSRWVGGGWENN